MIVDKPLPSDLAADHVNFHNKLLNNIGYYRCRLLAAEEEFYESYDKEFTNNTLLFQAFTKQFTMFEQPAEGDILLGPYLFYIFQYNSLGFSDTWECYQIEDFVSEEAVDYRVQCILIGAVELVRKLQEEMQITLDEQIALKEQELNMLKTLRNS